jgi:hypothetical protein
MAGVFPRTRIRAAIGLIAAYTIALQTLFAAFAPLPAGAQGVDFGQVICFGSGNAGTPAGDDSGAPVPVSGKLHCVLCVQSGAATILPEPACEPMLWVSQLSQFSPARIDAPGAPIPSRSGPARAPPLTV